MPTRNTVSLSSHTLRAWRAPIALHWVSPESILRSQGQSYPDFAPLTLSTASYGQASLRLVGSLPQ